MPIPSIAEQTCFATVVKSTPRIRAAEQRIKIAIFVQSLRVNVIKEDLLGNGICKNTSNAYTLKNSC